MDHEDRDLSIVLFGNSSAVQFGDENILFGQLTADGAEVSKISSKQKKISGRNVSVINILDLQDTELCLDTVDQDIHLISENEIHPFIFILQLRQLTDTDKVGLDWLLKTFGESVKPFLMILFTYEREEDCDTIIDDLKKNPVLEQLVGQCGDRYHTCSKSMNNQSEMRKLLEKIDQMVSENGQHRYTAEMFKSSFNLLEDLENRKHHGIASSSQQKQEEIGSKASNQITGEQKASHSEEKFTDKIRFTWNTAMTHFRSHMPEIFQKSSSRLNMQPDEAKDTKHHKDNKEYHLEENKDQLFKRLQLKRNVKQKIKITDVLQISSLSLSCQEPCEEEKVVQTFLQRLMLGDYRARSITLAESVNELDHIQSWAENKKENNTFDDFITNKSVSATHKDLIHPLDIQMAVFLSSDSFLQQLIVTKLSQCQYALPLLVPSPFTGETEFPLWTFRQIRKTWKSTDVSGEVTNKSMSAAEAKTPMVAFLRLGAISSSKSQLMNHLINEKHNTFFHRHCPGSSRGRLLMDGVVEIAWYLPSGKSTDRFTDCVAFCNLHGDAATHRKQLEILTDMSMVNVVVLDGQDTTGTNKEILKKLYEDPKPLICLICEDDSDVIVTGSMKIKIGLKDRNNSDVCENLRKVLKNCFPKPCSTFSLEKLGNFWNRKDEDDKKCMKGKEAAMKIVNLLKEKELPSKLKKIYLPCQEEWKKWCLKKKELHQLHGPNIEMEVCEKQREMEKIRQKQHGLGFSRLMKLFAETMSLKEKEKLYFLKWLGIFLDNIATDNLSDLHQEYNKTWLNFLELKSQVDKSKQIQKEQTKLEEISRNLSDAAFGMEHILREMGQIYESSKTAQAGQGSCLPKLAAEAILSGHPLELMDGDTGHVPIDWVSAILDELIKQLGDQRVFVLSVLGIQSSGKSTMLNTMFGLQFAVSAGRCTRGAFMQLVKVSEEMKEELKFDYILVVDTEGLQALEHLGMSTRQKDNELATFVVGLGNMTLINIFGENPAEMQDILQIVVQAFMRMKKVRLNPSCTFVHQNVGEITAGEKNMEGRRRLLDNLDKMAKLAAEEENFTAKCFSDVIAFDVRTDVWYFAQFWDGNPPMAAPNPLYCDNIQELKRSIISKVSKCRGVMLSEFKANFSNLWNALLNESFVFSFKNTLEIAVYRKLENEYSKWTWTLRNAMLRIGNKLHNRVSSEKVSKIDKKETTEFMRETKTNVEKSVKEFFDDDRDKETLIQWRETFLRKISELCTELVEETKRRLDAVIKLKIAREKVDSEKKTYEDELFKRSKELAFSLENKEIKDDALEKQFEAIWIKWVTELTEGTPSFDEINIWDDVTQILSESYDFKIVSEQQNQQAIYKRFDILGDYSNYFILSNHEVTCQKDLQSTNKHADEDDKMNACATEKVEKSEKPGVSEESHRAKTFTEDDKKSLNVLITDTVNEIKAEIQERPIAKSGYSSNLISDFVALVKQNVKKHESKTSRYKLKKEFTVDLCLHVFTFAAEKFVELQEEFKDAHDVRLHLERQRPQYLNIFKNYYSGASSTAIFGQLIVDTLEPSIIQAAYDQTAIDLSEKMKCDVPAFSGNRSNLEKHILTSLAEKENFRNYIEYIKKPKEYFGHFIHNKVEEFIRENCSVVLDIIKNCISSKVQRVESAVNEATEEVRMQVECHDDVSMWLWELSRKLQDDLQFKEISCLERREIKDLGLLQEAVLKSLKNITEKLNNSFQSISDLQLDKFRKKPAEILTEHLCRCCWAQCPFCNAICTNTLEGHDGDHSVPFHRNYGINGWYYKGTSDICINFCTTSVASDGSFYPEPDLDVRVQWKKYRTAGPKYENWSITPDLSELPYWKWFVWRFQKDLENHYKKKYERHRQVLNEWKKYKKEDAIKSLGVY